MESITLDTGNLFLEFDREKGTLVSLRSRLTGWIIHRRRELGLSWRMLVPVSDELRNNPVYGEKQQLDRFRGQHNLCLE